MSEEQEKYNILGLPDPVVLYRRVFVDITGSVKAALVLSEAVYWQEFENQDDGWWCKTFEEWHANTGLTRHEFDKARNDCQKYLKSELRGLPARNYWKVDGEALKAAILEHRRKA